MFYSRFPCLPIMARPASDAARHSLLAASGGPPAGRAARAQEREGGQGRIKIGSNGSASLGVSPARQEVASRRKEAERRGSGGGVPAGASGEGA